MIEALRLASAALFAVGPVIALVALVARVRNPSPTMSRIRGWRWYVPPLLLPAEWLLPPILIVLRIGETDVGCLPIRVVGLCVGVAGACLLLWASVVLGRHMTHEASVRADHALIEAGPYRFVRHPVYTGYLALLLGAGVAAMNVWLWLLWPVSLIGILIQAGSEERVLAERFGGAYERYARRAGLLVPRMRR
jgi:protein-S-isoprenylcysteine O-methyltransferase Ste14